MFRRSLTASMAVIAAFAPASSNAQSFAKFIKTYLPKAQSSIEHLDTKFFDKSSTPDFTDTEGGRTYTKSQALEQMRMQYKTVSSMRCKYVLLSENSSGKTGIAYTHLTAIEYMKPRPGEKKRHTITVETWEKETYVKTASGWQIKAMIDVKKSKMLIDGKQFAFSLKAA